MREALMRLLGREQPETGRSAELRELRELSAATLGDKDALVRELRDEARLRAIDERVDARRGGR